MPSPIVGAGDDGLHARAMLVRVTMPFADMLAGGHPNSLGRTEEVVGIVQADHGRLEELLLVTNWLPLSRCITVFCPDSASERLGPTRGRPLANDVRCRKPDHHGSDTDRRQGQLVR